jgi:hypothetical protein
MWRHPKYYKELRKRNTEAVAKSGKSHASLESDQAISDEASTEATSVRPGPGLSGKQQATSTSKPQATSKGKPQATSKRQASE